MIFGFDPLDRQGFKYQQQQKIATLLQLGTEEIPKMHHFQYLRPQNLRNLDWLVHKLATNFKVAEKVYRLLYN